MNEQEFLQRADACLDRAAHWLERFDPDELDYASSDGVVTLIFGDGQRFVLNRQSGNGQMWFAAGARAWHYDWKPERAAWLDDRDGHELFGNLQATVSQKLKRPIEVP